MTYDLLSDSISKITNTEEGTLAVMERKVEILRTPMWVTAISIVTIKN